MGLPYNFNFISLNKILNMNETLLVGRFNKLKVTISRLLFACSKEQTVEYLEEA
jgi:hypothetical protein